MKYTLQIDRTTSSYRLFVGDTCTRWEPSLTAVLSSPLVHSISTKTSRIYASLDNLADVLSDRFATSITCSFSHLPTPDSHPRLFS